jgi:uncharacterized Rossmann fold enzyme
MGDFTRMEITQWWPWYEKIIAALGYSTQNDREATLVLRDLLSGRTSPLAELQKLIQDRCVIVFGAGPSLEKNLCSIISVGLEDLFTLIAADGATTAFLKESITPNIIMTDLDGCVEDIIKAGELGSTVVIHGHGDNIEALREYVPKIIQNERIKVFGTTQVEPYPPIVHNFGGFTDGDRGVFLAEEMKAKTIVLAGMDLGETIGKFSKDETCLQSPEDKSNWLSKKKQKLGFAKELLEWLATWSRAKGELFNATGLKGETIKGFSQIRLKQLIEIATSTRR